MDDIVQQVAMRSWLRTKIDEMNGRITSYGDTLRVNPSCKAKAEYQKIINTLVESRNELQVMLERVDAAVLIEVKAEVWVV